MKVKSKRKSSRLLALVALLVGGEAIVYMTGREAAATLLTMVLVGGLWVMVAGTIIFLPPVVKLALGAVTKAASKQP
jgi:uncharacterized membrane protein